MPEVVAVLTQAMGVHMAVDDNRDTEKYAIAIVSLTEARFGEERVCFRLEGRTSTAEWSQCEQAVKARRRGSVVGHRRRCKPSMGHVSFSFPRRS